MDGGGGWAAGGGLNKIFLIEIRSIWSSYESKKCH